MKRIFYTVKGFEACDSTLPATLWLNFHFSQQFIIVNTKPTTTKTLHTPFL